MATIGKLIVDLQLNTATFEKGSRRARKSLFSTKKEVVDLSKKVGALGITLGTVGFAAFIKHSANVADQTGKTAQKLGLTTEALSELRFAAEQTGVKTSNLDMGLQRMTRRLSEAAMGTGEAKDAIKELGLDAEILAQKTPDQAFRAITEAMEGVESQSDKVRLAFKLFDSEGVDLVRTMALGTEGLDEMAQKARQLGIVITDDTAMAAAQLNDDLNELSKTAAGLGQEILTDMVGPMTRITSAMADAAREGGLLEAVWVGLGGVASELFIGVDTPASLAKERIEDLNDSIESMTSKLNTAIGGGFEVAALRIAEQIVKIKAQLREARDVLTQIEEKGAAGEGAGTGEGEDPAAVIAKRRENEMMALLSDEAFQEGLEFSASRNAAEFEASQERIQMAQDEAEAMAEAQAMAADMIGNSRRNVLASASSLFATLGAQNAGFAKVALALNTGLAIGQAYQNTAVAATKALTIDPTGGLSSTIWGYGKAQIGIIAANGILKLGGAGGGGGGAGGGGLGSGSTDVPTAPEISGANNIQQSQNVFISLGRDDIHGTQAIRNLIESINEEIGDGVKLNVEMV